MFKVIQVFLLILFFGNFVILPIRAADYKERTNKTRAIKFRVSLEKALARKGFRVKDLCNERDALEARILSDYGAVFLAHENVLSPPVCVFSNAEQVTDFQRKTKIVAQEIDGAVIELQATAMRALLAAREEALSQGLNITPRDGAEAARRSFDDTVRLWNSRFFPALKYWQQKGKLSSEDVKNISSLSVKEQVPAVLELERHGIYFSRDFSKSILYSVAAPGTSQHLSLLAFDANEYADQRVRRILARHGWFRTVKNDLPHFTYLGLAEKDLTLHGLRKMQSSSGEFWIPSI